MFCHEFRIADEQAISFTLQSDAETNPELKGKFKEIAKEWIRVAEDYRRNAIFTTFTLLFLTLGLTLLVIYLALVFSAYKSSPWPWAAFILAFLSLVFYPVHLLYFWRLRKYKKIWLTLDCFSLIVSKPLGILLPFFYPEHLKRWEKSKEVLKQPEHDWLKRYLEAETAYSQSSQRFPFFAEEIDP